MKALNRETVKSVHELMEHIWEDERILQDWNLALICPVYQKRDPNNYNNHRGIALLNGTYKIFAYCMLDRITPRTKGLLEGLPMWL